MNYIEQTEIGIKPKYEIGDSVYSLVDCGDILGNQMYIPVRYKIVDRFTGNDEQIYYQLENNDEVLPFTDLELDEIREDRLFVTAAEANDSWEAVKEL